MKQKIGRKLLGLLFMLVIIGVVPGMNVKVLADDTELEITGGGSTTNITWTEFVNNVNNGTTYEGKYVKLLKDISYVENKINIGKPFNGTFDGDGHTMIVDFEYGNVTGAALFPTVGEGKSITVKNLTLGGKISGGQHTAGIVGSLSNNNKETTVIIDNVIIVADISQTSSHVGGFVGHAGGDQKKPNTINIKNCHFLGKLSRSAGNGSCTGGFVGWRGGSTKVSISDSGFGGSISDNTGYFNPWVVHYQDPSHTHFTTSGSLTTNRNGKNGTGRGDIASYTPKTASCSNISYNIISEYQYDGSAHGLQISTTAPVSGAIITYGTEADKYVYTESPTLTTSGEKTVYYQIACPGYNTVRGSVTLKVNKGIWTKTQAFGSAPAGEEGSVDLSYYIPTGETGYTVATPEKRENIDGEAGDPTTSWDSTNKTFKFTFNEATSKPTASYKASVTNLQNYEDFDIIITVSAPLKMPQTVSFKDGDNTIENVTKPYSETKFTYTATPKANMTLPQGAPAYAGSISYASSNLKVASVNPSTGEVEIKGVGVAVITASAERTVTEVFEVDGKKYAGYLPASASYTLTVNKAPQTITAENVTVTYGDTDKSVSASVTESTTGGGAISYVVKGGSGEYVEVDATSGALTIKKAGSATVIAKAAATGNYAEAAKEVTVTVNKATVTVTAKDQSIYVGGAVPDLSAPVLDTHYTVSGLVGTDALTTAPTLAYQKDGSAAPPDNTTAGTYDIVPSGAAAGDNYAISYTNGTLTITARNTQTITASDVTATYGDTDKSVSATTDGNGEISYTVKAGSENYIDVNTSTGALTIKAVPADGKAYVTVKATETTTGGTGDKGYAAATKDVTVNIGKATVTVAAENQSIYVGGPVPDLSAPILDTHYTVSGLVGTDALTTAPTLAYQKDGSAAPPDNTTAGTYDIVPSGAAAGDNYAISYTNGTLTITARNTQTITASDVTATYGDTDKSVSATTDGNGEISYTVKAGSENYIDVNTSTGALTIKAVPADGKAYVTVKATETTTGGTGDKGYAAATKDVTVNIGKAEVTVTAKDQSIYVGGTVPTLSGADFYTVNGLVGEETLTTAPTLAYQKNGEAATPDSATAGTYDIVPSGAAASDNYSISYTNGTLTISNKGTQTISAENVTATYGDTDKSVSATVTDPATGGGDISYAVKEGSGDYIEINASTGALTIKAVPADGKAYVIVTAAETSTYTQATKEVTVTINKANAVAATVTANSRTYDGTEKPLVSAPEALPKGVTELQYALGTDGQTPPNTGWDKTIPSRSDAGT